MLSTGQLAANGLLQPTGRPVMAITCRPAAFRNGQRRQRVGVMAPSVVRVSSMSVSTPKMFGVSVRPQGKGCIEGG